MLPGTWATITGAIIYNYVINYSNFLCQLKQWETSNLKAFHHFSGLGSESDERLLLVRYEDLLDDGGLESELRRIVRFLLGTEAEKAMSDRCTRSPVLEIVHERVNNVSVNHSLFRTINANYVTKNVND